MSESDHKIVFLELEEIGASAPSLNLQLKFPVSNSLLSDSKKVVEAIKVKKPHMHELFSRGQVVLQIESDLFPGKFQEIGEDSPIKDKSCLKSSLTRPPPFHFESHERELGSNLPCSSVVFVKTTHTDTPMDDEQEQGDSFTNPTSSNEGVQEQGDTFRNQSASNEELISEIIPFEVTESILVGVDKEKDGMMEPVQQSTKRKHTVRGKQSLAAAAIRIPQKEFVYTSYKLPTFYGQNLDIKMKSGLPFFFWITVLLPESWANLYNNILLKAILKSFVLLFAKLYLNSQTCSGKRRRAKLISNTLYVRRCLLIWDASFYSLLSVFAVRFIRVVACSNLAREKKEECKSLFH